MHDHKHVLVLHTTHGKSEHEIEHMAHTAITGIKRAEQKPFSVSRGLRSSPWQDKSLRGCSHPMAIYSSRAKNSSVRCQANSELSGAKPLRRSQLKP